MRKLKLQVQMTVDGFVAGPNGEMDFMVWNWDDDLKQYVKRITEPVDCIVLGRRLAEGFIPHWAGVAANPDDPEHAAGRTFTDLHKVVFTRSLETSPWDNTELAKGELVDEITALKERPGGDIIAYGGATLVSELIRAGLVDEYHLFVNPAVLGDGLTIFGGVEGKQGLALAGSRAFDCGVVALHYRRHA